MRWLGQRLIEAFVLLLLGLGLGLTVNAVRRDPLPYNLPGSLLLTESGARVIMLGAARRHFDEAHYVFVDARDEASFLAGHIQGALSLPPERFQELYPELQLWTAGQPLLLYGESGNILACDDLAQQLRDAGEEVVVILSAGFDAWEEHGFPTDAGPEGLLTPSEYEDEAEDRIDDSLWLEEAEEAVGTEPGGETESAEGGE